MQSGDSAIYLDMQMFRWSTILGDSSNVSKALDSHGSSWETLLEENHPNSVSNIVVCSMYKALLWGWLAIFGAEALVASVHSSNPTKNYLPNTQTKNDRYEISGLECPSWWRNEKYCTSRDEFEILTWLPTSEGMKWAFVLHTERHAGHHEKKWMEE